MNDVQVETSRPGRNRSKREQRERLVGCAEVAIEEHGLAGLRARDLAACAGCSVGGIYNLVGDLDELVLLVGQRTMSMLDDALDAVVAPSDETGAQLMAWARAYADFAARHRERWRALFEFRMATARDFPDWFAADQMQIFTRLEACLAPRLPQLRPAELVARARALFAAVHGIVSLGLDDKLVGLPPATIDAELVAFVTTYVDGLACGMSQGVSGTQSSVASR